MTKIQFRVLYREFLFRMVDLEILSAHALGDSSKLLGQFAAILLFLSMGLSLAAFGFAGMKMSPPASLMFTMATEEFLISTTMLVVGLFAVLSWDSTFPNRRDVMVLSPLPVRGWTMFLAKVAAVATALSLTIVFLHGASGLLWPMAFAMHATAHTAPALTFDPTPVPVSAANMQSVLDRDLAKLLSSGVLAPGTGSGLSIGVVKHGERRVFSYGTARPDSLFEIGSITKTFTGLMLAQMVAQKQVTLDEPIRLLLPPGMVSTPHGDEIRLIDLATQHSGLPRMAADWRAYLTFHGVGLLPHPPFLYSNFGFGLLGQLLADRAGVTYSELLKDQVTGPLGLNDTAVSLSGEQQARLIQGYDGGNRPVPWDDEGLPGSGAIRSTAADVLRYLEANLHADNLPGTLPAAMAMAHRPRADGPAGNFIGLAWWHSPTNGIWWHGGAMRGFTSNAFYSPQGDYAAIVLWNHGPDAGGLADLLADHIRERLEGTPAISLDTVFVPATSGFLGLPRWFVAYWFTMLSAGTFVYCSVLSVQGLAAQILPRRIFLRVSGFLQLGAFCLFVGGYFLQPLFNPETLITPEMQYSLRRLPQFWFLGLFHQLNGSAHPALVPLAHRAWLGLAIAVAGTAIGYTLSYLRSLRQIVEEPDITPGVRSIGWLPPFGNRVQTAIGQFSVRSLVRSRQHRMILAFYLGIGFALTIFLLKDPMKAQLPDAASPFRQADTPLLAASIAMMVLAVVGTRVVFAIPLDLRANWMFQIMGVRFNAKTLAAGRRSLAAMSAVPVWGVSAALCIWLWPWRQAVGHLVLLALIGMLFVDLSMLGFRKIPFTCSYLPGKSQINMVFLGALGLLYFVMLSAKFERDMLQESRGILALITTMALLAGGIRVWSMLRDREEQDVRFEETQAPAVQELGLHRDGVMPVG